MKKDQHIRCILGSLIILAGFFMIAAFSPGRKKFTVRLNCYSPWGFPVEYKLTERGLLILSDTQTNAAFSTYKEIYKKDISSTESDSIYQYLRSTPYDTLKSEYGHNILDGTTRIINLSGYKLKSKQIIIHESSTDITFDILEIVDNLIPVNEKMLRDYLQ